MKLNITGIMQVLIFWPNSLNTFVLYYMLKLFSTLFHKLKLKLKLGIDQ